MVHEIEISRYDSSHYVTQIEDSINADCILRVLL